MFHTQCILEYAVSCGNRQRVLSCPVCRQTIVDLEAHDEGAVERIVERGRGDERGVTVQTGATVGTGATAHAGVTAGAVEVVAVGASGSRHETNTQRYNAARRRWMTGGLGMFATLTGCVLVYWLATDMP